MKANPWRHSTTVSLQKNWCDLKRDISSGKVANAELARDLASFAVDGGTLIVGLDERCAGGSPLTPVDLSAVTPERIEQVAAVKVDPPLTVECSVVAAPSRQGEGYVLVHVPVSPLAPHQVNSKYMGRGQD
jgi:predicted HTH transcriptional regulator